MKPVLVIISLLVFFNYSEAQIAMSFEEANAQGLSFEKLDGMYKSGVGADSIAVFKGQEEAYVKAYYSMLQDLGSFLNNHNFYWGGQVRCNNRIYFDADGSVDYYLFNFESDISKTKQNEFKDLLNRFIVSYKFGLTGESRFAQCSPVNYRDPL